MALRSAAPPAGAPSRQPGPVPSRPKGALPSAYDLAPRELAEMMAGQPSYRVRQVWDGLYQRAARPGEMTDLPAGLRSALAERLLPALSETARSVSDDGGTVKWRWQLGDGAAIESVLMHYRDRSTVCVSTQAGCAMACQFCATGQAGFKRHLSTGEIVEQVAVAIRQAQPRRVSNVVFMGMGEPLANYDRVWGALDKLHRDFGISARHLTVSTVGLVPGIRRMTNEDLPVNLAVSLHAANDELRSELVPINRRWPLAALQQACRDYVAAKGRRLSFEWALIGGVNDRMGDARELAAYSQPLGAHVNLIPLNPTPGYLVRGTPAEGVRSFRDQLVALGVNATIRSNRGGDIDAACGQLAAGPARGAVELLPTGGPRLRQARGSSS